MIDVSEPSPAALDQAHLGDIEGAFGTIRQGDTAPRAGWLARVRTLLAIIGPGLITMVADNDAGAFGTYTEAGQNYGTTLLWTLLLLIPVLYVNQEMVLRLGAVTGIGHARLIFARFGRFWGAFSIIDLFLLNALTIVTEFIGVALGLDYLGIDRQIGVVAAAALIVLAVSTGDFRRFERFAVALCFGSVLLIPIFLWAHPPIGQLAADLVTPQLPADGSPHEIILLIIGIVGTTIAPWQLFFQQSYVVDKRITQHFLRYERADLWIGIAIILAGAVAMMAFAAQAFAGHEEFGHFADAGAVAAGLGNYVGPGAGVLFAVALIDASIIGASAVSLASAYAVGDVLALKHSLHRKAMDARGFYAIYAGLILLAAVLVLAPGTPLGLLTSAVQSLAGMLLPSATVFLLLLCNDRAVLGPWVNGRWTNIFTGGVIAVLVVLSLTVTISVLVPALEGGTMMAILMLGIASALLIALLSQAWKGWHDEAAPEIDRSAQAAWRMPPLATLAPGRLTALSQVWLAVLRLYLAGAGGLLLWRIVLLALGRQ
jgi:NRAMP (natural resistance-associated macrophage protein)-like metal ion transporter